MKRTRTCSQLLAASVVHVALYLFVAAWPGQTGRFSPLPRLMHNPLWDVTTYYVPLAHDVQEGHWVKNASPTTYEHRDDGTAFSPLPIWLLALLSIVVGAEWLPVACSVLFPPLALYLSFRIARALGHEEHTAWLIAWVMLLSWNLHWSLGSLRRAPLDPIRGLTFLWYCRFTHPALTFPLHAWGLLSLLRALERPTLGRRIHALVPLVLVAASDPHGALLLGLAHAAALVARIRMEGLRALVPDIGLYTLAAAAASPIAWMYLVNLGSAAVEQEVASTGVRSRMPKTDVLQLLPFLFLLSPRVRRTGWPAWAGLGLGILVLYNIRVFTGWEWQHWYYLWRTINPWMALFGVHLALTVAGRLAASRPWVVSWEPRACLAACSALFAFGLASQAAFARQYAARFRYTDAERQISGWFASNHGNQAVVLCWNPDLASLILCTSDYNTLIPWFNARSFPRHEADLRLAWGMHAYGMRGEDRDALLADPGYGTFYFGHVTAGAGELATGVRPLLDAIQPADPARIPFRLDYVVEDPRYPTSPAITSRWEVVLDVQGHRVWRLPRK